MPELNKFKVITLVFILIFVFCIAAMYSNTKDVASERAVEENGTVKENIRNEISYGESKINKGAAALRDLSERVSNLEVQYNKMNADKDDMSKLNCNIQGVMNGEILVPLSEKESLNEARNEGKELILLCTF